MEFKTIQWNREKLQVDQPQPVTCEAQFSPELNLGLLLGSPKPYPQSNRRATGATRTAYVLLVPRGPGRGGEFAKPLGESVG